MMWTTRQRSEIGGQPAIVAGEGVPVLLLHGVGLRAETWNAQLDGLSEDGLLIAADMPGHGTRQLAAPQMGFTDYVQTAASLLRECDPPAVVVGHSMGAMVALALAAELPEHVSAVAALNAVFERDEQAAAAVMARAERLDGVAPADPGQTLRRWFGTVPSPERTACEDWLRAVDPAGYKQAYTAFAQSQMPDRQLLGRLTCPALFMTGRAEPNSTPAMSQAMAELAPKGRAVIVDDAAHMMPMTHAVAVNAELRNLIKGRQA